MCVWGGGWGVGVGVCVCVCSLQHFQCEIHVHSKCVSFKPH